MNVLNDDAVAAFCEAVADRANAAPLREWCMRNLSRHVLRSPEFHDPVPHGSLADLQASGEIPALPHWVGDAVARGDALALFRPEGSAAQALARDAWRVVDHRNAVPAQMSRVSVPEAVAAADAWEREEAARRLDDFARRRGVPHRQAAALLSRSDPGIGRLWPEADGDARELSSLPDGHRLVEVLTRAGLDREGTLMDHCVATYWPDVEEGTLRIVSLRDPSNLPLATMEVSGLSRSRGIPALIRSHLPKDLQVAWQVRGPSNAKPPKAVAATLSALMAATGLRASDGEARWAGLGKGHSVMDALDREGLAAAMPAAAAAGGPGFLSAVRLLMERLDVLADPHCASIVASLAPRTDSRPETDLVSTMPEARRVTWRVPNALLTSSMAPLAARVPDAVRDAFLPYARAIVEAAEADPGAVHAVEPSLGKWRSERPFMAWCGLDARWEAALRRSAETRRGHLRARQADYKRRLREAGLPEEERGRLHNAVNVAIPRLLAAL